RLIACALSVALIATAMPANASAAAKPVKLAKKSVTLKITNEDGKISYGKTRIKLKTAKGVKIKSIKYKVKNKKIAKVSKKGVVTAKKKGKTKIKVAVKYTYKNKKHTKKLTYTVKVKKVNATTTAKKTAKPASVSITNAPSGSVTPPSSTTHDPSKIAEIHMIRKNYITYVGGSTGINPKILPETAGDSQDVENLFLDYQSKNPDIAVVNEYGLVTGKSEGVTTIEIKAKDGSGVTASATVKVVADQKLVKYVDDYYEAANAPIVQEVLKDQEESGVSWSAVGEMEDTISEREDAIIQDAVEQAEDNAPGSPQDQIAALYQTAEDKSSRETSGIGALTAYVEEIDAASTVEELLEIEAELDRKGIAGIFNTVADLSQEDAKTYKLYFNLSDYALSEYSFNREDDDLDWGDDFGYDDDFGYGDDMEYINSEEALQTYADSLLKAAGEDETQRSENIAALKEIFQQFAVNLSYDDLFDQIMDLPEEDILQFLENMGINMMVDYSPEDLQKLMENCDLLSYLEAAGYGTTENIVVVMPSQMQQIDACLTEKNLPALKEYAKYEMLNQYATCLSEEIYNNYSQLYKAENGEAYTAYEDFALTKTKELLEWEISSIYTEQYESEEKKEKITDMVDKIAEQYSKEIDACSWMSDATKKNAQKKLSAIGKNVLYPDDYSPYLLENDLSLTEEGGSLLDNIMVIDEEYAEAERAVIGDKMTSQDWMYSPLTVNAFYLPTVNGIYICAGMTEKPVFDLKKSDAMNYGSLGMIIAHEISHAFDETGALYDENGDEKNWWTEKDASHYAGIQKKLVDYYNTYYLLALEDMPLFQDGETTLSENIADLAGVACVMKLVEDDQKSREDFFISFANMWAEVGTLTDPTLEDLLVILFDEHSVAKVRVNAVVSMLDEFYETFGVQEGDAMYVAPEERIRIWG
ncbi:MAG: Ig-like domain-containing protein, partial [Lachnospiraceae bacterium]|nr:Ig-like domain-containing protein [Lachnospiraceae bacterium]